MKNNYRVGVLCFVLGSLAGGVPSGAARAATPSMDGAVIVRIDDTASHWLGITESDTEYHLKGRCNRVGTRTYSHTLSKRGPS